MTSKTASPKASAAPPTGLSTLCAPSSSLAPPPLVSPSSQQRRNLFRIYQQGKEEGNLLLAVRYRRRLPRSRPQASHIRDKASDEARGTKERAADTAAGALGYGSDKAADTSRGLADAADRMRETAEEKRVRARCLLRWLERTRRRSRSPPPAARHQPAAQLFLSGAGHQLAIAAWAAAEAAHDDTMRFTTN